MSQPIDVNNLDHFVSMQLINDLGWAHCPQDSLNGLVERRG